MSYRMACVFVFALLSGGCALQQQPGERYTVHVDPSFGTNMPIAIDALQEWETMAGVRFDVSVSSDRPCGSRGANCEHAFDITYTTAAIVSSESGMQGLLGDTIRNVGNDGASVLIGATDAASLAVELRHEIGHALALIHTTNGTLMYAHVLETQVAHVTCADVGQYNILRGLPEPTSCVEIDRVNPVDS